MFSATIPVIMKRANQLFIFLFPDLQQLISVGEISITPSRLPCADTPGAIIVAIVDTSLSVVTYAAGILVSVSFPRHALFVSASNTFLYPVAISMCSV